MRDRLKGSRICAAVTYYWQVCFALAKSHRPYRLSPSVAPPFWWTVFLKPLGRYDLFFFLLPVEHSKLFVFFVDSSSSTCRLPPRHFRLNDTQAGRRAQMIWKRKTVRCKGRGTPPSPPLRVTRRNNFNEEEKKKKRNKRWKTPNPSGADILHFLYFRKK